jgi:hypothetical protein
LIEKNRISEQNVCNFFVHFEYLVCSEINDKNTIEHCRLSQCDRTRAHAEEATKVAKIIITQLKDTTKVEIIHNAHHQ